MEKEDIENLVARIRQIAYDLHVYLGAGLLEKVYENGLVHRLLKAGFRVEAQKPLRVFDSDGFCLGEYFADLLIEGLIVVELKAVQCIANEHYAQIFNYLKITGAPAGLLINFGSYKFEVRTVIPRSTSSTSLHGQNTRPPLTQSTSSTPLHGSNPPEPLTQPTSSTLLHGKKISRIAIIGLVGKSMFFDVPRFHAGGETITARGYYEEWGGKGFNQAVAAARQGATVMFLGAVNASDAKSLRDFCRKENVCAMLVSKAKPTSCAAILTDGTGETRVTVCPGAELEAKDVKEFAPAIATADFLLLNNEVPEEVNLAAVELARKYGTKIIFNPAPSRPLPKGIKESVSIFTPNEFEAEAVADVPGEVVTTLGARGCRIRSTGEVVPAPQVKAVDSTGAGDTFNAVLAVRLAEGESLRDACAAANEAASRSVAVRYVMPSLPRRGGREM